MKKHQRPNGLIQPHKVTPALIEQILNGRGYNTETDDSCILVQGCINPLLVGILEDCSMLDMSGLIELRRSGSLRRKLRFVNWLNNANPIVRFSLWESVDTSNPIDRIAMPDGTALWGSISLPFGSGFAVNQFLAGVDLLIEGLDQAFVTAIEDDFADPPMCEACAEKLVNSARQQTPNNH